MRVMVRYDACPCPVRRLPPALSCVCVPPALFQSALDRIDAHGGGIDAFSRSYEQYGFNRVERGGLQGYEYREWAPGATWAALVGDFNVWDKEAHPLRRDEYVRVLPIPPLSVRAPEHGLFTRLALCPTSLSASDAFRLPAPSPPLQLSGQLLSVSGGQR